MRIYVIPARSRVMARAAIVGVGWYGFLPSTPEVSFREMVFEAATRAYADAGVDPRTDIDAFISAQEDFWEGIAISDEFAPEPVGGVLRPTFTVAGDGMQALAHAVMMVETGMFDLVAVEAHAKPSDIVTLQDIIAFALDPLHVRPVRPGNPLFMYALDAQAYMLRTGATPYHFALVSAAERTRGLGNVFASFAARVTIDDVLEADPVMTPLTGYDIAGFADAAIVMVVSRADKAFQYTPNPVFIDAISFYTETGTGTLEWHAWGRMPSMRAAAREAYSQAGVGDPASYADFAIVEDRASNYFLMSIEELGLAPEDEAHKWLEKGEFEPDGPLPVNPGGGSLATGVLLEATGLARVLEAVINIRADGGRAIVASWRGPPTTTSMVALLSGPEEG